MPSTPGYRHRNIRRSGRVRAFAIGALAVCSGMAQALGDDAPPTPTHSAAIGDRPVLTGERPRTPQQRVLILSTFEPYIPSSSRQERGIREALGEKLPYLSVRTDHILPAHLSRDVPTPEQRLALAAELRARHAGRKPDVVITVDTLAYQLVANEARDVFEGVPVVYSGLTLTDAEASEADLPATGVLERIDPVGTVQLIKRLQPDVEVVLFASREVGAIARFTKLAKDELAAVDPGVKVLWSTAGSIVELEKDVAKLPPGTRSAVVNLSFRDDTVSDAEAINRMALLPRPLYATFYSQMRSEFVGGHVVQAQAEGHAAGLFAVRVLRGEDPRSIAPSINAGRVHVANHPGLKRWGIDPKRLPAGTQVMNKPEPWLEEYRQLLVWGTAAVALQAIAITLLVVSASRTRKARRALEDSEKRFRSMFERHLYPMWVSDRQTRQILAVNDAACRAYGYTREEFLQRTITNLMHPDDLPALAKLFQDSTLSQEHHGTWRHVTAGGRVMDVLIASIPLAWKGQSSVRLVTSVDITNRKSDEALRDDQLHVLERLAGDTPLDELLRDVVRMLERHSSGKIASLVRSDGERLRVVAGPQLPGALLTVLNGALVGPGDVPCCIVMQTGRRLVADDVMTCAHAPAIREACVQSGLKACWSEPVLAADGTVLGSLALYSTQVGHPTDRDRELLRTAASLAGIAIQRRTAEETLAKRERFIQQIASAAPTIIYVFDLVTRENQYINDRVLDTLGYTPAQIKALGAQLVPALFHPDDVRRHHEDYLPRILKAREHEVVEFEYRILHADGGYRTLISRDMILSREPGGASILMIGTALDVTEQNAAAARLRDSEARLATALKSGRMGVFDWDVTNHKMMWNAEHVAIWELPTEGFDGDPLAFKERIHPDDYDGMMNAVNAARESRTEYAHQYRLRMPDGRIKWLQSHGKFEYDAQGNAVRMVGLVTDISDARKRDATNLALIRAIPDVMFRMDRDGRYLDFHARDPSLLLVPPAEFLGKTIEQCLPEYLLKPTREALDKLLATGQPQTFEYESKRGDKLKAFEVRMVVVDEHEVLTLVRNITDRRDAERSRDLSRQRYSNLVSATPLGVIILDRAFKVLEWNDGASKIFGQTAEEVVGQEASFIIPESQRRHVADVWRRLITNVGGTRSRNTNIRKDGREIICEWYNTPLLDQEGRVQSVACVVEDVTEADAAQKRQDLMLAELDHRVKNNLASVLSLADRTGAASSGYAEFIEKFRMRLLALSRMHTILARSHWSRTDLRELIDSTLEAFGASARAVVTGPATPLSPRVAQSVAMAINELATNAVKYGSLRVPSGSVRIQWTIQPDPRPGKPSRVHLEWTESGGPEVVPPEETGFGSALIRGTIGFELSGSVEFAYLPGGLVCKLVFPLIADEAFKGVPSLERFDGAESPDGTS